MEVISRATRRTDESEKKDAYLMLPSLSAHLLVEQESATVVAFQRTEEGFVREVYSGLEATIPLAGIDTELPLADIFDGVEFTPEPVVESD